jgi:F420-dependent oxidoreductase-like protein
MTRLGYQIPNFTYPSVSNDGIFDAVIAGAKAAEKSGFDRILLMDHFHQLPGVGDIDSEILECYTTLAAIAQHTSSVRLSALVTGNTYRNPAILAKIVTTLDHVSHGRATLGIGSGWFEQEHDAFGIPFNTFTERFEKLEEALNIILPMLRDGRATLSGDHYDVTDAINSPPPVSRIPLMIGGSGEKKTLRTVAKYAQAWNTGADADTLRHKADVLRRHCEAVGRDPLDIEFTAVRYVVLRDDRDEAAAVLTSGLANNDTAHDIDLSVDFLGSEEDVAEQWRSSLGLGFTHLIVDFPSPFDRETMERLPRLRELVAKG